MAPQCSDVREGTTQATVTVENGVTHDSSAPCNLNLGADSATKRTSSRTNSSVIANGADVSIFRYAITGSLTLLSLSVAAVVVGILVHIMRGWVGSRQPLEELRTFADTILAEGNLENIAKLPVDDLSLYAQAACVQAESASTVRRALRAQLSQIPAEAREDIVSAAVIEGASTQNSVQNTSASAVNNGKAHHYIAFWSTHFAGTRSMGAPRYSTCVTVAGVNLAIAEHVAGWKTSSTKRVIAHSPCECGFLFCARCPVFHNDESRTPIFKRHVLTLEQQVQLQQWMLRHAVDRAKSLTGTRKSILSSVFGDSHKDRVIPGANIDAVDALTFHGKD